MSMSTMKTLDEYITDCPRPLHRLSCYSPLPSHAAQDSMRNSNMNTNHRSLIRNFATGFRRQSSVNDYKLPNILSLAVTDEEAGDLSVTRLSISNSLTSVHKACEDEDNEATNKLLDIGRVASWAVGFEKLLNDEMGLHIFTEFLKKEFSQENIQFWTECEKLKKITDPDEIRIKANSIWTTYLHDTDDGSCRINIDSRSRQECQQSLLNKPNAHIFEKAQSQIFQLMKLDSYTRFLKSNMYKECIMSEMEGKSLPYSKPIIQLPPPPPATNEDRSKPNECLTKIKEEEKKDKKRSPLIPWTKAFIKWKRLSVKRDTPSSSSNIHQTANASTNTFFYENSNQSITNKSASVELTSISNIIKIPITSSSLSSFSLQSPTKSPLITIGNSNKIINKYSSNINQQDLSLCNLIPRSDINQDQSEKKTIIEHPLTTSIDSSRFCRFIFPDSTSTIFLACNETNTIQHAINRLFAKRGITWYRTELYLADQQSIDLQEPLSSLCGKDIYVETRILVRIDLPTKILCVRCDPKRTLLQILQPIFDKFKYTLGQFIFYVNDSLIPLNLNDLVGHYDNQRIFSLLRTASGVDISSRQKCRTTNDIFEMISENDEDIKFDECGILKVVTQSKATFIVSNDAYLSSSTSELSMNVSENNKISYGSKR
ncbi:unnamed protein product [Adineta steineri]|uniref:RGS domain-containing protein n=2 Tax=Adineta steineri TaxID=433720 RepID=A0A818L0D7_9BILA|nr:unnamed protein product [Adineta steineri]